MAGRRERTAANTRAKLLRAGRRAFANLGYAATSMDVLTADAGLTRGALYHHFGGKEGLLQAVIEQIDAEMSARMRAAGERETRRWDAFLAEGVAYIEMSVEPEIRRVLLLDGPAVLGDPSRWPINTACLDATAETVRTLVDDGTVAPVDAEVVARLLNGAALNASLWVASSDDPAAALAKAVDVYRRLAGGLLRAGS